MVNSFGRMDLGGLNISGSWVGSLEEEDEEREEKAEEEVEG